MENTVPDYPRGVTFEQVCASIQVGKEEFDRQTRERDAKFEREKRESMAWRKRLDKIERITARSGLFRSGAIRRYHENRHSGFFCSARLVSAGDAA